MKHRGNRVNVSSYAAAYSSAFGSFVADKIVKECQFKEPPCVLLNEHPEEVLVQGKNMKYLTRHRKTPKARKGGDMELRDPHVNQT